MVGRTVGGTLLVLGLAVASPAGAAPSPTEPAVPAPVDLGGTPVEPGIATDPTTLTAGLWAGTLTGPGTSPATTQYFRYERRIADSTVLVGATATSSEDYDNLDVDVQLADGTPCDEGTSSSGSVLPTALLGTSATVGLDEDGNRDPAGCAAAGELLVAVGRGSNDRDSRLPYTLRIVEEAPVSGTRDDPAEGDPVVTFPSAGATTRDRPGAASFADAPEVGDGDTIAVDLAQGTQRLWRVHLDWGQSVAVSVDVPGQDDEAITVDPRVELGLLDPLHVPVGDTGGVAVDAVTTEAYDTDGARLVDGTAPVGFLDRFASGSATVPGDYFVSLAASPAAEDPVDVPLALTIAVTDEGPAAPGFSANVTGPGGGAPAPEGYAPETPYLVADGVFSADVSGTPSAPGEESAATAPEQSVRRTLGLGTGGASLVALLAGAWLLRRRARVSRAAAS